MGPTTDHFPVVELCGSAKGPLPFSKRRNTSKPAAFFLVRGWRDVFKFARFQNLEKLFESDRKVGSFIRKTANQRLDSFLKSFGRILGELCSTVTRGGTVVFNVLGDPCPYWVEVNVGHSSDYGVFI